MVATRNARTLFKEVPTSFPEPGKHIVTDTSETIDLDNVPLNGGFLVKTLVLSIDPYLRGKMRAPEKKSYSAAFTLGEPIENFGVGVVLRSENDAVKVGQHIYGVLKFVEYAVLKDLSQYKILSDVNIPLSCYVGVAGMPGQTASYSWQEYSKAKKGEVAFVSTGAGAVGSLVIQLAKQQGLKVIGSAGSDEKVQFMKDIGADVAFNYKTQSTREVLEKEGPIDIFYDNVGGETLEAALDAAAVHARFILCGAISGYNDGPKPIRNMFNVVGKSISINGFIVNRLKDRYEDEFYKTVPADIAAGKIKYQEHKYQGLESSGTAILDVQQGRNTGKAVIVVADH